jgi:diguanylate cyclase (GGDEF)-like protein/PAS domain S-box-containing protein
MDLRTQPDLFSHFRAIQNSIDAIPDEALIASFLRHALLEAPGQAGVCVCLRGMLHPHEAALEEARRACAAGNNSTPLYPLRLANTPDFELIPIATLRRVYGFLAIRINDPALFNPYASFFKAAAEAVAHSLEARDHLTELNTIKAELKAHVIARRCAETLYQDCQRKHWEAQEIAGLGCWDWEPASEIYHWSDALNRIFGRNPNRPPPDFEEFLTYVHPNDRKTVRDRTSATLKTGAPLHLRYRIIRFDGEERILETRAKGFRNKDGKLTRIVGVIHDVTQSKRDEDRLHREAVYSRGVIDASPDPLIVVNADGNITDINDATLHLLEKSREELIDTDFSAHFESPEQARVGLRAALMAEHISDIPVALPRASGELAQLQMNASVFRLAKDDPAGVLVSLRDVTEIKRREEALTQLPEQMSEAMAQLQQRERDTAIIAELNQTLQTCNTQDEAYPLIAVASEKLFPWASGALALFITPAHELSCVIKWGPAPNILTDFVLDDCWGLRRGQLHQLDHPGKGALCRHFETPPEGPYMCLPLAVHGEAFGVLHLTTSEATQIDENSRRSFITLGDMVKLSLSNLKLRESLRFQAVRDPLTNLYNRQYLGETLSREISRARRHRLPLSVAILDIDFFKVFNDEHGHEAGDTVLKEVGALLRMSVRTSDIACRYGGEEFLFVLPECDLLAARARVEHICQEIKRKQCIFHGQRLPNITMSAGIAQLSEVMTGEADLIEAADKALYSAKGGGRDRIAM